MKYTTNQIDALKRLYKIYADACDVVEWKGKAELFIADNVVLIDTTHDSSFRYINDDAFKFIHELVGCISYPTIEDELTDAIRAQYNKKSYAERIHFLNALKIVDLSKNDEVYYDF